MERDARGQRAWGALLALTALAARGMCGAARQDGQAPTSQAGGFANSTRCLAGYYDPAAAAGNTSQLYVFRR